MTLEWVWENKKGHRPRLQLWLPLGESWRDVSNVIASICGKEASYRNTNGVTGKTGRRYRLPKRFNLRIFQWWVDQALKNLNKH